MGKQNAILIIIISVILVSACQPSPQAVRKAIAKTQTAQPPTITEPTPNPSPTQIPTATLEPTQTLTPLKEINLSEVIFHENDLPQGYAPSQITHDVVQVVEIQNFQPVNMISQNLAILDGFGMGGEHFFEGKKSVEVGDVSIYLFELNNQAKIVYRELLNRLVGIGNIKHYEDFGEESFGDIPEAMRGSGSLDGTWIAFHRCSVAVFIFSYMDNQSYEGMLDYAISLDKRIKDIACR